jgi:hypothetical protein
MRSPWNLLRGLISSGPSQSSDRRSGRTLLQLEQLEDRLVPASPSLSLQLVPNSGAAPLTVTLSSFFFPPSKPQVTPYGTSSMHHLIVTVPPNPLSPQLFRDALTAVVFKSAVVAETVAGTNYRWTLSNVVIARDSFINTNGQPVQLLDLVFSSTQFSEQAAGYHLGSHSSQMQNLVTL